MNRNIGKNIKELRKYLGLTQEELARNICSQSMISKIEKHEEVYPSAEVLYQLGKRLGVSLEYFFINTAIPHISYVDEVQSQLNKLIQSKNYWEAYQVVKLEKYNPIFQEKHLRMYLLWREAICISYLENNFQKAINIIDSALELSETTNKNYSLEELDILTSKAIFYSKIKEWEKADILYKKILFEAKKIPFIKDKTTLINCYYNSSRISYHLKKYEESLELTCKGIKICKSEKTYFLLGHLYYQKGQNLFKIRKSFSEDVILYFKYSLWILKEDNDMKSYNYVKRKLKKLESLYSLKIFHENDQEI